MYVGPPLCLSCKYFQGRPVGADDRARCAEKSDGIPDEIYFEARNCSEYEPKSGLRMDVWGRRVKQ